MIRFALLLLAFTALPGCAPEIQSDRCGGISTLVAQAEVRTSGTFLATSGHGMIFNADSCDYGFVPQFTSPQAAREATKMLDGGYFRADVEGVVTRRLGRRVADIGIVRLNGLHAIRRPLPSIPLLVSGDARGAFSMSLPPSADGSKSCITHINVWIEEGRPAKPAPTDEIIREEQFWKVRGDPEGGCLGHFPLRYGFGQAGHVLVSAKPLQVGDMYRVHIDLGSGRSAGALFRVLPDGRMETVTTGVIRLR